MMPDLRHLHDLGRVGVEHAVVVGLAILREGLVDLRIGLEPGRLQARLDHAQAAEREDRALERLVGLQADDDLVVAVDVARLVRQQGRRRLRIDGEHALLRAPPGNMAGASPTPPSCAWTGREECSRRRVRRDVADDEVAHVDRVAPPTRLEIAPAPFFLALFGSPAVPSMTNFPRSGVPDVSQDTQPYGDLPSLPRCAAVLDWLLRLHQHLPLRAGRAFRRRTGRH